MSINTKPYNPFDYLQSDEEIANYLTNAFMDDAPRVLAIALGYLAKAHGIADSLLFK